MIPTPHPADALPLPEPFMAMCRDTVPHIYDAWANQLRAARREGYELAMSNTRERLAALAEEFEAAIPTDAGLALAAMIREGVTSLGSHIGYAVRSLGAPTPNHSPGNMAQPIHDPAVTTPREVLVGESPVDRIAAPAQQQAGAAEVSDEHAYACLSALADIDTSDVNLRDNPDAYAALESFAHAILALKASAGGVA